MTSNHENDAFELRFEDAVRNMHKHSVPGEEPDPVLWKIIRSQMGTTSRAETADLRAIGPDLVVGHSTTERKQRMDATLVPISGGYTRQHPRRIGWMAMLAAGLVGIMIITSVWLNGDNVPRDNGNNLAWAPVLGTPASTPASENSCAVEPLTEEEAVQIILNPMNETVRLQEDEAPSAPNYMEWGVPDLWVWQSDSLPLAEEEIRVEAITVANTFWECLATGTTLQVWALMAPETVQYEVILKFPVIRSEQDIRDYVAEFGHTQYRYTEGQFGFGPSAWNNPQDGMRAASELETDILVSAPDQYGEYRLATVPMYPVEDSMLAPEVSINLYLKKYPEGEWRVVAARPPDSK